MRVSPPKQSPLQTPNKGWHSRGYLPHFDSENEIQSLNFRLFDAVPIPVIMEWRRQLGWYRDLSQNDPKAVALRRRIETYEDAGYGACFLRDPRIAKLIEDAMLHFDGERYHLLAWCVMPNHVHSLFEMAAAILSGEYSIPGDPTPRRRPIGFLAGGGGFGMMTTSIATSATTIIFKTLSNTSNRTLSRPVWSPMQRNGRTQAPEEEGDRPELGTSRASSVQLVQGSTPHLPCVLPSKLHGHYMGFGARDARAARNSLTRVSHLAV